MCRTDLEVKDSIKSNTCASYLDSLLSIGRDGQLCASIYDKQDYSNSISQIFRSFARL